MRIILGLGNPGPRYVRTRHNAGFLALERLATAAHAKLRPAGGREGPMDLAEVHAFGEDLVLARPMTYMNESGRAAAALAERHAASPGDFLVLYDDVALPLGRLRLRPGGSSGGHKGMESVIERLGSQDIPRLRLGILGATAGQAPEDLPAYVLEEFAPEEWPVVEQMLDRSREAVAEALRRGVEIAASRFNRWESPPE